jgi:4'-phosphopantetheinyl transferase
MSDAYPPPSSTLPFPSRERDLHLWYASAEDLANSDFILQCETCLRDPERERADGFVHLGGRNSFVVGRAILRRTLGAYLGVHPTEVPLTTNTYGRPQLATAGVRPICFNVSHSDGTVVVAFAIAAEVGVDIERIRVDFPYMEVARCHFARSSWEQLIRLKEPIRRTRFYERWVLLEAYAKCVGMGLSLSLTSMEFDFDTEQPSPATLTAMGSAFSDPWSFWLMAPLPSLRLAVALSGTNFSLTTTRLRPEGLETVSFPILAYGDSGRKQCCRSSAPSTSRR